MFYYLIHGKLPVEKPIKINGRWGGKVYPVAAGFDIETTNDKQTEAAFMYIWQFAIGSAVFAGRTWDDFFDLLHWIKQPAFKLDDGKIIVYIHNMNFEMSFLLPQIYKRGLLSRVFAKDERNAIEVELNNGFCFCDSMALTNMSLASLARNYTKTQKLVGDLDYSIPRNSTTKLSSEEINYCINDVEILKEYAEQLHAEYTRNGKKIPLTSTGIVRQYVKNNIEPSRRGAVNAHISKLFPKTVDQYNFTMRWLFRGGYTHANTSMTNKILHNVVSYDFTSAYPSILFAETFEKTQYKIVEDPTIEKIEGLIDVGRCVIFLVDFYDIEIKTYHCIESKHKIIDFSDDAIFDNGRLYSASHIRVLINDVDYSVYQDFYKWSRAEVVNAKEAHRGKLPRYLFDAVCEFYKGKKELKAKVKEAEKAKQDATDLKKLLMKIKGMLNSCYGMCVSRLNFAEWVYEGDWIKLDAEELEKRINAATDNGDPEEVKKWKKIYDALSYEALKAKQFLSPYWGIRVTSICRRNILHAIVHFNRYAVYSDTDSIKILTKCKEYPDAPTVEEIKEYFDKYNASIVARNARICDEEGLDVKVYSDIGTFDFEGNMSRFKTLGAKRYIFEKDGDVEAVVAGLPKSCIDEYVKINGKNKLFDFFSNGMYFQYADKNAHKYTGEVSAIIEGEEMHELGSCYIYETSFRMNVVDLLTMAYYERKELDH